jgi:hypothetical protein
MDSAIKVHPANGTKTDDQATSAADRKLLDRLVKLWRSHAERDFETRHRTGRLLNERLNPPTERQPQGQRVLKTAAKELGVAESDLSRMRWLAHLFADVAALRQAHPEITNWTRFKEALPSLVPPKGGEARKPAANPSRPVFGGVARSLASLAAKLDGLDSQPGDAERKKLVDGLRELAEAAYRRFKIRIVVAVE